ncbi:hypothetical protein LTR91_006504 [Friedmanniomyces endolithicus]|uniref:Xylanolytic transcriptional activator regulatory domain-containing protein n=1 Tax=Friedmanniomyces endolithicus TaxID=329885 RepID=A0AAN6QWW2_9PEZI|nr:hypothetical protein LTS02_008480 [Friedmanniomyces endolithicus]KAK0865259.1 hypothetical protein LTR87_015481 [Friedmanniomyces endolithicus]KAK0918779.1 hypothetical protein LTR57_011373 [Friedmanniomyces endolithicus]KAK0986671.1 hypothetical protein LTS01_009858 [Friedmanniomyces endolithicus]KAK0998040.1 hypothetical protein LTR91_006504 [Friedmanniomyces endolithicus]
MQAFQTEVRPDQTKLLDLCSDEHHRPPHGGDFHDGSIPAAQMYRHTAAPPNVGPSRERNIFLISPSSEPLSRVAVDVRLRAYALQCFGSLENVHAVVGSYFQTIHQRATIVHRASFLKCLPTILVSASADYVTLCLSMQLLLQQPSANCRSMQSTLYANVKSTLGLLEALNYQSLEVVQSRLLCVFYEMGHGILPAASISLATCAKVARSKNLHKRNATSDVLEEERKRTWWMLLNLDRFLSVISGDPMLCTRDPNIDDTYPIDDGLWLQDLARECQASQLAGKVIRHIFDPTPDAAFQEQEAVQLERTLMALMPLLVEEELQFGNYCSAFGICTNALFVLHDSMGRNGTGGSNDRALDAMEPLSIRITQFSLRLFGTGQDLNYGTFSPYVPLSLYQAAVVQLRLWKRSGEIVHEDNLRSLKHILEYYCRRWLIAGVYLHALEQESPALIPHALGETLIE